MNLPNKLTIIRLILIPVFVAVYFINFPFHYLVSAIIFVVAALTDLLDGKIARKYNLVTDLGKFLDPIADKVLVSTALIVMLSTANETVIFPWYASIGVAVILARELIVSGLRMVAASKGVVLAADWSGKIKTCTQDAAIVILLVFAEFGLNWMFILGFVAFWAAVLLTIVSGTQYLVKNSHIFKG